MGNKWDKLIEKLKDMNSKWDKLNKELDDALEEEFGTSPSNILDVFENAKLVLREHLIANKEEVVKDLEQMREWSNTNKQETLEEAAVKYSNNFTKDEGKFAIEDFINGAKWQQERSYSEEEVFDLLYKRDLYLLNRDEEVELELPDEWFKQFKKK